MNDKFKLLGFLWVLASLVGTAHAEKSHPNVLLFITDDQGFGDIQSHGNDQISTPYQDQLAAEGVRFDRYFVSPVCAPTRAALLTGRYHPRTGVHGVTRTYETMRSEEVTIAEILKANGYATGAFGKWHNGAHYPHHPNGQGFDEFYGFCAGHWNNYFDTELERNGVPVQGEGFIIDDFTNKAMAWIREHNSQPWFCYMPYNTPHTPWQVPEKYWRKYQGKGLPETTACAYAMVENIDDNIGRMLSLLEELGETDNTIVLFMTDNGANTDRYNAGMRGRKGSPHEGGTRVPLFVRYPAKIEAGRVVKPITAHIDILPTLVELTGVTPIRTKPLDGRSLVPLMHGETEAWPNRMLFTEWGQSNGKPHRGAVRTEQWRAVLDRRGTKWMLFDMQDDPGQKNDLAKEHPAILDHLKLQFEAWFADVARGGFEPIPTEIGHPQMPTVTLHGHEAFLQKVNGEGISYLGANGWANDYITQWTDTNAYATWPVKVVEPATYRVSLDYIAREKPNAEFRVSVGERTGSIKVTEKHDPPPVPTPDRIPRKEVYEQNWKESQTVEIDLAPGEYDLNLRLYSKQLDQAPEIKSVRLQKLN